MKTTINLADLREKAKGRPEGYYEDVISRGEIQGEFLSIDGEELKKLVEKYRTKGLGDYVAEVLQPVARAIDGAMGTDLEHCEACQKRKDWLNRLLH